MSPPVRRIAVLTTGRQDWGILRSTCRLLAQDPWFELRLMIGGMHCSRKFGLTQRAIAEEDFCIREILPWIPDEGDIPAQEQAAAAIAMIANALVRQEPETLLLAGDRFEIATAALAATLHRIPLIHVHGGEETEGAFDDALRHAVTKMSHLHLVSHPEYRQRVIKLGEDPATVHVVGAPGLDNLHREDLAGLDELQAFLGLSLRPPVVLVTLHPATLGGDPAAEAAAVCRAMDIIQATYVITLPNSDPGNEPIRRAFLAACAKPGRVAVEALGERRYWGLMRLADAMLGNSSSALIEAPVLGLPAVNVGERQKNRLRGQNIVDVPAEAHAIGAGLRIALAPAFRTKARKAPSPFGQGRSGQKIIGIVRRWSPPQPPIKARIIVESDPNGD